MICRKSARPYHNTHSSSSNRSWWLETFILTSQAPFKHTHQIRHQRPLLRRSFFSHNSHCQFIYDLSKNTPPTPVVDTFTRGAQEKIACAHPLLLTCVLDKSKIFNRTCTLLMVIIVRCPKQHIIIINSDIRIDGKL